MLAGRIIEVLQNARRAGATKVEIYNKDGTVTIGDNGSGIEDFAKLLDLGASGWPTEGELEASEDPAGVGLFCLAPRKVTVRSRGSIAVIPEQGWTGAAVEVQADPKPIRGTQLEFEDEPWAINIVKPLAIFTGLDVVVDGEPCPKERFLTGKPSHIRGLGCRIQVVKEDQVSHWHRDAAVDRPHFSDTVLVNFYGQVVGFDYHPVSQPGLSFLVDLTGEPTGLRLMLPARTRLLENDAFQALKAALEREAFLYLQKQGQHTLPFKEYLRARDLGIELPEADPTFTVGLLRTDMGPEPIPVTMPKGHLLANCYRLDIPETEADDTDDANVHLLAALGDPRRWKEPFVPVQIRGEYDGYGWARLPTVRRVELSVGKTLLEEWVGSGQLICVDALTLTAYTSDGKTFRSNVPVAVKPWDKSPNGGGDYEVYVTSQAQQLNADDIWYHLGGWNDGGDTYDTQQYEITKELDRFWEELIGPDEPLRVKLLDCLSSLKAKWRSVTILASGGVTIHLKNGKDKVVMPPPGVSR
jgi:hypothetical protein